MTWVRDTNLSIRENIVQHLLDRYRAMEEGVDGYTQTWVNVLREPITKPESLVGPTLALIEGSERNEAEVGATRCTLTLYTEFWLPLKVGANAFAELNRLMSDVQRCMRSDIYCGGTPSGLTLNIVKVGDDLDVQASSSVVGGIVIWEVQYRHASDDPRKKRGE